MKRYEKMSKEEILEMVKVAHEGKCDKCKARKTCDKHEIGDCTDAIALYMDEEVNEKPRYEIYKTADKAKEAFKKHCDAHLCCSLCNYIITNDCKLSWLYGSEEEE